jgi:hypothetical protein
MQRVSAEMPPYPGKQCEHDLWVLDGFSVHRKQNVPRLYAAHVSRTAALHPGDHQRKN